MSKRVKYYGIYNNMRKIYQFGIVATSPHKAMEKLEEQIGKGSYKWRFEVRSIKHTHPYVKHAISTKQVPDYHCESEESQL